MARFTASQREDGYFVCEFVNSKGNVESRTGPTAEIAIAKVEKAIALYGGRAIGEKRQGTRQRREGAVWGRPKGTTNAAMYARQRQHKAFQQLFGDIRARAVMASSAIANAVNVKVTEDAARKLLDNAYRNKGRYNTYTGNLERSYAATVIQGRNVKNTIYLNDTPQGNPVTTRNGKRIVYIFKRNHGLGVVKQNSYKQWRNKRAGRPSRGPYEKVKYRYFKRWERIDGYKSKRFIKPYGGRIGGFGYMVGDRLNRVQSGIILENMAPYAGAVEARGYQVLPGGVGRAYSLRSGSMQTQLVNAISKRMLQAAKFI